jgi:hypothetical protein
MLDHTFNCVCNFCIKLVLYLNNWLTNYVEQSPSWEAYRFSASQKMPCFLWNPRVRYHIHKCPPPVPIPCQISPVHVPLYHFFKIHFNLTLPLYTWMLSEMHAMNNFQILSHSSLSVFWLVFELRASWIWRSNVKCLLSLLSCALL